MGKNLLNYYKHSVLVLWFWLVFDVEVNLNVVFVVFEFEFVFFDFLSCVLVNNGKAVVRGGSLFIRNNSSNGD